ncbi:hypothetical protein Aasi_0926 [Candidatus Amoebophilus asiaticus 5a2]|uniref:VOC domain-containing protein n=1 Tax=Amoebophilus asiaticus (strain 5a2) TaxID=452471 RepID=B3EST9_AMOA5|nr:VOC family protein [Candidatus Amoebophilus asiaticus]ACE06291.1 hypothetical protein Aasi_0926 [Candidatus Amoebophilus asiaticus 5a2]
MIDHITFAVNNFSESLKFYDETMHILGIERLKIIEDEESQMAGYGQAGKCHFGIFQDRKPNEQELVGKARGFHLAFTAPNVNSIHEWHQKCLELGSMDNGAPGPRPHFNPGYYAAFIIDPNGWRIEAMLRTYMSKI